MKRNSFNKWYWPILLLFILGGLFYHPAIGLLALVCMIAPVITAPVKGRMWCGRFCPRGSFFDQVLTRIGPKNRRIPQLLQRPEVRWTVFTGLMAFMSYNMYLTGGNIFGIGKVLFKMVLITTGAGIVLGVFFSPRSWCKICPMGSLAMLLSKGSKLSVRLSSTCRSCGVCAKKCPFGIPVHSFKTSGVVDHPDCLKCGICVSSCPVGALKLEKGARNLGTEELSIS
ncbi:4Fe-4S binding protein [Calderihabitans maritimus]|uniref:4Fe-4S ferredoxin, iron-sulfur binding n=1 Tax=Calderihabitans maritimus TaxID=1246530 RepID=A0A1Z5HQ87_9FIRM|nr:4Fe-4S binding protein [Calderihabitans maritimus]GAW91692.1 4Fe-4S ferredoxin, iron-sulfur binding [Calderihabitans maritimus]